MNLLPPFNKGNDLKIFLEFHASQHIKAYNKNRSLIARVYLQSTKSTKNMFSCREFEMTYTKQMSC